MKYILSIIFLFTVSNVFYASDFNQNNNENIAIEIPEDLCQNCWHEILKSVCSDVQDVTVIEFLLSKIKNINTQDKDITALHIAAANNSLDIVKLLVEKGANVNATTVFNATPAHMAARQNKLSTVLFLKQNGAHTNIEDFAGFKVDTYLKDQEQ